MLEILSALVIVMFNQSQSFGVLAVDMDLAVICAVRIAVVIDIEITSNSPPTSILSRLSGLVSLGIFA